MDRRRSNDKREGGKERKTRDREEMNWVNGEERERETLREN